jgi:hypothetical protein
MRELLQERSMVLIERGFSASGLISAVPGASFSKGRHVSNMPSTYGRRFNDFFFGEPFFRKLLKSPGELRLAILGIARRHFSDWLFGHFDAFLARRDFKAAVSRALLQEIVEVLPKGIGAPERLTPAFLSADACLRYRESYEDDAVEEGTRAEVVGLLWSNAERAAKGASNARELLQKTVEGYIERVVSLVELQVIFDANRASRLSAAELQSFRPERPEVRSEVEALLDERLALQKGYPSLRKAALWGIAAAPAGLLAARRLSRGLSPQGGEAKAPRSAPTRAEARESLRSLAGLMARRP